MAGTRRLNPLDASWLAVDSITTPMHVASLLVLSIPEGAPADFTQNIYANLRDATEAHTPWNLKLKSPALRRLLPVWEYAEEIDIDYHVRHSALPKPGGERELGMLVSRLHSRQMDFTRPLWECHLIEGLEGNRIALYTKMHHSMVDGVSGMRMLQRTMGESAAASKKLPPPWAQPPPPRAKKEAANEEPVPSPTGAIATVMDGLKKQASSMPDLARALTRLMKGGDQKKNALIAPFAAPESVINGRITGQRRFATQQYDLARLKKLAKAGDATLNDIVLWLCATALRRFLKEAHHLPGRSMTAGIPVNVRPADDQGTGNAISFIMASLGTDIADPVKRLRAICNSTRSAKDHLQTLPRSAITQYTMLVMAPYILSLVTGMGGRTRPVFNVTISNVPGPDKPMYFQGAKLEAMYPVSLLAHGSALNITCVSYNGKLNFGFTGARDTLPKMQRLSVYTGEALEELEKVLLA
ncbi:MAG TPA: wax ester/triacylglycerol synthase family O-acyltransferase [Verrucomicrobiae bacterium]|nr:wax ester/triacylglycerol synthase family O-acyltransferase [Verrucomicrobiae bacterium]